MFLRRTYASGLVNARSAIAFAICVFSSVIAQGCASSPEPESKPVELNLSGPEKTVVITELNFDLYEIGFVRNRTPRDDWNVAAKTLALDAMARWLSDRDIVLVTPQSMETL